MKDFWAEGLQNRRKSKIIKAIILWIILIVILIFIILCIIYYNNMSFRTWCDENIIKKEVLQEDVNIIEIGRDENIQVYAYDKYICVLSKKTLDFYNRVGTKIDSIEIDILDPEFVSNGRYLAISEKNGQKFYLISDREILFENNIEGNITEISVNRNGFVSVLISNTTYKSVVEVFDKTGKEIFRTNLVSSRVIDISISQDSKYLAIAEVDISGIIIKSNIMIVSFEIAQTNSEEAIIYKYEAPTGKLITNINYQDKNKLVCMFDDSIGVLENETYSELLKYDSNLSFVAISLNNRIVTVQENSTGEYTSDTTVSIVNTNNGKTKKYHTNNVAKAILTYSNKIAINFGTELHIIGTNGILIKKYISNSEINDIVMTDNLISIVYNDNIAIINF